MARPIVTLHEFTTIVAARLKQTVGCEDATVVSWDFSEGMEPVVDPADCWSAAAWIVRELLQVYDVEGRGAWEGAEPQS
jgi:hypothetical protein